MTEGTTEAVSKPKLPEFNPKHKVLLEGLLYLGRLERKFSWAGHDFKIKTLNSDERLRIGQMIMPWMGTLEEARAWIIAQVGVATITVDDQKVAIPLSEGESMEEAAFRWARQQYPWTIDAIYAHILDVEAQAQEVIEEMGKA
jgi:hypothetical protein